ncbi:hypothetical protein A9Z06_13450 [Rhizobium sp. YK2]|nr:hypothetical protein A9Z06_13450 [Rhizobium sp. YK2]
MPSILDKELGEPAKDAFGHQHFADMLRNLVESRHQPPFSIGLLGSWGTGKSSIKELYLSSLRNDNTAAKGVRRRDKVHAISFNAWRYGGEQDIKRALLRDTYQQLGGDDEALHRHLHNQVTSTVPTKRSLREWFKEAAFQNIASAALFLVIFIVCLGAMVLAAMHMGLSALWAAPIIFISAPTIAGFLIKYVVDLRLRAPSLFLPQTTITFPATKTEEYERLLVQQIGVFRKQHAQCTRLVVFVDDLDRLSATEMVAGLDAIRTFLELSLQVNGDGFGVIFVISCDEDRIADALSRGRGKSNTDLPATVVTRSDARRYLDRLFQFRLEIPPIPKVDLRGFAIEKFKEAGNVVDDLKARSVRLEDLVDRLIHPAVESPRNAIQILNAFLQSWWIANLRERNGSGSLSAGGLHPGAVTNHPLALAALSVMKVDFPDFYNALQKRPELIQDFSAVVFRNEGAASLSLGAQIALKDFLVTKDEVLTNETKPDSRPLRQYLSSLQGLRWPKHLQPLLLLAEDSISRKYGDGVVELLAAFVSADTRGVLEVLGHHLDNADLSPEDVRLLEQLVEDPGEETSIRRINKALVIAELAPRIPPELRPALMVQLARELARFKELRTSVRPSGVRSIIGSIGADDSRDLAEAFGTDLLTGQELDWRLRSGQSPNIDELAADVVEAVDLTLAIREAHGLGRTTETRLLAWLLKRDVRSKEGSQTIAFSTLETFVEKYGSLLTALSSEYVDQAIAEFMASQPSIGDTTKVLADISTILERLFAEGQQSRETAWRQLASMASVVDTDVVVASWKMASIHGDTATPDQATGFLSTLAERLAKIMRERPRAPPIWRAGASAFLDLLTAWDKIANLTAISSLIPLLKSWSAHDVSAPFMVRAAEIARQRDMGTWSTLLSQLLAESFGGLPATTVSYVASHITELADDQVTAWAAKLTEVINTAVVNEKAAQNYATALDDMPQNIWAIPVYQTHLQQLLSRLIAMYNDKGYQEAFFPSARKLFDFLPPQAAGTFLNTLFEQAYSVPLAFAALHGEMIEKWPAQNDHIGQYNPDQLAVRAAQFVRSHVTNSSIATGSAFRSGTDLYARIVKGGNSGPELVSAAASLWPIDPDSVLNTINQLRPEYTAPAILPFLIGPQPQEWRLQQYADAIVHPMPTDTWLAVANLLLAQPPIDMNGLPDGALSVWLNALGDTGDGLRRLLKSDPLNDDQQERLLQQAFQRRSEVGVAFFVEEINRLLRNFNGAKASRVLYGQLDELAGMASTGEQKSAFASQLIAVLPHVPTDKIEKLATTIRALNGKSLLERSSDTLSKLDQAQLEVIVQEFGDSKPLKKALEDLRKE